MKKLLKPGFLIFLASLLVLSLALPGYAAGKDGKSKTNNLALEKISEMPKEKKLKVEAALENYHMLMDLILSRENLIEALKRVEKNKGSHGIDGMSVKSLRRHLYENWETLC